LSEEFFDEDNLLIRDLVLEKLGSGGEIVNAAVSPST
jgi:hypothetical protein